MIQQSELLPDVYYWAQRKSSSLDAAELEVVQISAVFGPTLEYFSVVILGSDQHFSLNDFEFLVEIDPPNRRVSSASKT